MTVAVEGVGAALRHCEARKFERLDRFGIERRAPAEVAGVIGDFFVE